MHFRYREYDPSDDSRRRMIEQLKRLYSELLLRAAGDAEQALEWVQQVADRYDLWPEGMTLEDLKKLLHKDRVIQTAPDGKVSMSAGGERALRHPVEGAEDDAGAGAREVDAVGAGAGDVVVGIAAGGTTPFVHGALGRARELGAATGFITCVPREQVPDDYDVSVRLLVGPEVLAGSSRLKAGTATKLTLNALTTITMSRLGKTHRGRMVDVDTSANAKLVDRGARLVAEFGQVRRERALELLDLAGGSAKLAILMAACDLDADAARARLDAAGGVLARALQPPPA